MLIGEFTKKTFEACLVFGGKEIKCEAVIDKTSLTLTGLKHASGEVHEPVKLVEKTKIESLLYVIAMQRGIVEAF